MSADVPLPPLGSIGPNGGFVSVLLTHLFQAMTSGYRLVLLLFQVGLQFTYYRIC